MLAGIEFNMATGPEGYCVYWDGLCGQAMKHASSNHVIAIESKGGALPTTAREISLEDDSKPHILVHDHELGTIVDPCPFHSFQIAKRRLPLWSASISCLSACRFRRELSSSPAI